MTNNINIFIKVYVDKEKTPACTKSKPKDNKNKFIIPITGEIAKLITPKIPASLANFTYSLKSINPT
jgi:hypothetical protein